MRRSWILAATLGVAGTAVVVGRSPSEGREHDEDPALGTASAPLEIVGGRWFDGRSFRRGPLWVAGGRFVADRPAGELTTIDAEGRFVVPAFADAHTHLFASERDAESSRSLFLERGVVYVANLCGPHTAREATAPWRSEDAGVEVLFTNGALTARGAHPVPLYRMLHERRGEAAETFLGTNADNTFYEVTDAESLERKWALLLSTGPDLVKFMLSSDLDEALVPPLVRGVHDAGLRVVCHLDTRAQFRCAVRSGVDVLAHTPGYGVRDPDELEAHLLRSGDARDAAERGLVVVTTAGAYAHREDNSVAERALEHNLALLRAAGVTIAFGSDDWQGPDTELRALHALSVFSDVELLRMLCETTPRVLHPERAIGRIAPGFEATFAIFGTDPRTWREQFGTAKVVVRKGRVILERS